MKTNFANRNTNNLWSRLPGVSFVFEVVRDTFVFQLKILRLTLGSKLCREVCIVLPIVLPGHSCFDVVG